MPRTASKAKETTHAPQPKLPIINALNANHVTVEDSCQTDSCALMETESLSRDLLTTKVSRLNTSQTETTIKKGVNCLAEITDSNPIDLISVPVEYVFDSTPPTLSKKPHEATHDLKKKTQNQDSSKTSTMWKKIEKQLGPSTTNPNRALTIGSKRSLSKDEVANFKDSSLCGKWTKTQDATHIKLLSTTEVVDQPRQH